MEAELRDLLNSILKDFDYNDPLVTIKPVSSEGANYTSALYEITVVNHGKQTLNLFGKIAIINEKLREDFGADKVFLNEYRVYSKLSKAYEQIEDKYSIPKEDRYMFPKFYGSKLNVGSETFILENLCASGYVIYDRFEPMDYQCLFDTVTTLAKFHALGFALEKEQPDLFHEFESEMEDLFKNTDAYKASMGPKIEESIKSLDEEYRNRIHRLLDKGILEILKKYFEPSGRKVLIHGDYRGSNILHKRVGNKVLVVPVDYQCVRIGSAATDLLYLITFGSDEEFRRNHFESLIEHYYKQLTEYMERVNLDVHTLYPKSQFDEEVKNMLPVFLVLALAFLPTVFVDPAEAPQVDDEEMEISKFFVSPNARSTERLGGLIRDFIRWEII